MNNLEELRGAIKQMHGCEAVHLQSVPVREEFKGAVVWNGQVELFQLTSHPKATRCYAWSHLDGKKGEHKRFIAVLELPPVDSALAAVRAAIISESRNPHSV